MAPREQRLNDAPCPPFTRHGASINPLPCPHRWAGRRSIAHGDPSLFTFSMHCGSNFPLRKACGDLDIPLEDGVSDSQYLTKLDEALEGLLGWPGAWPGATRPDLVIYDAGVDVHEQDRLGRLALSDR
eukprot:COSAG01_NODE_19219_length_1023_cov_14.409091_2_plen_128_part_00